MESSSRLRVVLDTNVVLHALSPKLPYRQILRSAFKGEFEWCVTSEILLEYEEKNSEFFGEEPANTFLEAPMISSFIKKVKIFYRFNILPDLDDNKFLDCAFAANAHYIVSDDRVFKHLEEISFPKIHRIKLYNFSELIQSKSE